MPQHHSRAPESILATALLACVCAAMAADDVSPKAVIAVVGDADRFNIGQDGFCGKRTELDRPGNAQFRIPSQTKTYFFVRTTFKVPIATYYCEGDFSFTPEAGRLHIIRYSFEGNQCRLEVFSSPPGETPRPFPFEREARRSCLVP